MNKYLKLAILAGSALITVFCIIIILTSQVNAVQFLATIDASLWAVVTFAASTINSDLKK